MIPKIIHQIFPEDKQQWNPLWFECHESWKKQFSDFEFIYWNDDQSLENLIKIHFPQYHSVYLKCPSHITRIDFARYFILHLYGGIYADMDVYCYQNFYDELIPKEIHLMQSRAWDELVQNSLMISEKSSTFLKLCYEETARRILYLDEFGHDYSDDEGNPMREVIGTVAGPKLLEEVLLQYDCSKIGILPKEFFNPYHLSYDSSYRTKHMLTGRWGKQQFEFLVNKKRKKGLTISDEEFMTKCYEIHREFDIHNVTVENFDFYTNYESKSV
jgi:mannosyltransferase OCH1-like enzyme